MSRNKREGRFDGKHNGKFVRMGEESARKRRAAEIAGYFDRLNLKWPIPAQGISR